MSKNTPIEKLAEHAINALVGQDCTIEDIREITGMTPKEIQRAVNWLKSQGRIETRGAGGALLHLRRQSDEASETESAPEPVAEETTPAVIDQSTFDYSLVPADTADSLRARGQRIREIKDKAAIDLGRELTAAQDELADHVDGTFQKWVEAETGMSRGTAYNLINVFKRFGSRPKFGQLNISLSAQYELAKPSTPDEVIEDVIQRAEAGERITHKAAKAAAAHVVTEGDMLAVCKMLGAEKRHRNQLESQAGDYGLTSRALAATLQKMEVEHRIVKDGFTYWLPVQPQPSEADAAVPAELDISPIKDLILQALRAADEPLTRSRMAGLIRAQHSALDEGRLTAILEDMLADAQIRRVVDGSGEVRYGPPEPDATPDDSTPEDVQAANDALVDAVPDNTPEDAPAEDAAPVPDQEPRDEPAPRPQLPLSVDTAKEMIIDALRKSQRPLGRAELRKYAGLDGREAVYDQAFSAMLDAGSLDSIHDPGFGRRFHFPDILAKLYPESFPEPQPFDEPAAPAPNAKIRSVVSSGRVVLEITDNALLNALAERWQQSADVHIAVTFVEPETADAAPSDEPQEATAGA